MRVPSKYMLHLSDINWFSPGPKQQRKFRRLMMHRIKWAESRSRNKEKGKLIEFVFTKKPCHILILKTKWKGKSVSLTLSLSLPIYLEVNQVSLDLIVMPPPVRSISLFILSHYFFLCHQMTVTMRVE